MEAQQILITHIAKPQDSRCKWFQAIIEDVSVNDLINGKKLNYLRRGADLELKTGTFLIDAETQHHRKSRGWLFLVGLVTQSGVKWIEPNLKMKMKMKDEGHLDLMVGSGDFTACLRVILYLMRQENVEEVFEKLKNEED